MKDILVRAFGLIVCLFASACAGGVAEPPTPLDADVAVTASAETREACEVGAKRWFDAAGLVVLCDAGPPMWAIDSVPDYGGYTDFSTGTIVLTREYRSLWVPLTGTHELGHLLGGHGHPEGGSVMRSRPYAVDVPITASDLEWVCARANCSWFVPETKPYEFIH